MSVYLSFAQVYRDTSLNIFPNEATLKQAFVEALKEELKRSPCNSYVVEHMLLPVLDETLKGKRPDIRVSNLVIEIEPPGAGLDIGRQQLHDYMNRLYMQVDGRVNVLGMVTDGINAELWVKSGNIVKILLSGDMPSVATQAIQLLCSNKIPVVTPEDLVRLFGV